MIQSESTVSEADNQNIVEIEQPPAEPPPIIAETQSIPMVSLPTPPAPTPTPIPTQPRCSELTVHPTWRQAAIEMQKTRDLETETSNKAIHGARTAQGELKAKTAEDTQSAPSKPSQPSRDFEVAHLAYMAAHGLETPLSYHDAVRSPQADQWHKAMEEEYNMLME